jgi:chromosome segregation and condensation protein ScpB/uncharacterized cupredoxin-like copper-binding protein
MGQRLSRWEQSRAKNRLEQRGLVELVPRLRQRAVARSYLASAEAQLGVVADPRTVLAGASAAHHLGWALPAGTCPVEIYVPEAELANLIETHALEVAAAGADIVVRAVPETWPFPPHLRAAPEIVAALDLAEATITSLAELGRARLDELSSGIAPSWQQRPQRRRLLRASVPSSAHALPAQPRPRAATAATAVWDDQAERDARGLVALLHVAGGMRRAELSEAMRISSGRLDRACAFLHASPPHGLVLVESGELLELASAPDCGPLIERVMNKPAPEPLSRAALEVLTIVAYEQPLTRSDISHIRGTDSSGVIETLLARELIEDDPRWSRTTIVPGNHGQLPSHGLAWAQLPSCRRSRSRAEMGTAVPMPMETVSSRPVNRTIQVDTTDALRFTPEQVSVRTGETSAFEVGNPGAVPHEFFIGTPAEQQDYEREMASDAPMHAEPGQVDVPAGQTVRLVYTLDQPGSLEYGCHIPGHYPAGMRGTITITLS